MAGIAHVSVGVNDVDRAKRFYDPLMALVGLRVHQADAESVDYGVDELCFSLETPVDGKAAMPGNGIHVAFGVRNRACVRQFHEMALQLGGNDAGAPGLRPEYSPTYYGAFVLDPDGNKIEVVCAAVE